MASSPRVIGSLYPSSRKPMLSNHVFSTALAGNWSGQQVQEARLGQVPCAQLICKCYFCPETWEGHRRARTGFKSGPSVSYPPALYPAPGSNLRVSLLCMALVSSCTHPSYIPMQTVQLLSHCMSSLLSCPSQVQVLLAYKPASSNSTT